MFNLERATNTLRNKWAEFAVVCTGYTLLTLVLTYPLVRRFSKAFIGDQYDSFQNVWNMWWVKKALLELHTHPYYTHYLHHPHGTTLFFQTLNPFNGLISIPLQFAFSMEVVYNSIVLFSFVASGVGMYYLARRLVRDPLASFVAGVIYTFSSYHFAHALGHLQLIAMEWLPVYLLFFLKVLDEGGKRNVILAVVSLILTNLCSWYYLVYALCMSGLLILAYSRRLLADKRRLLLVAAPFVIYLVVMSPLLVPMIQTIRTTQFIGAHDPEAFCSDLTSFFTPSYTSTYRRLFRPIWHTWTGEQCDVTSYIGYLALSLSVLACFRVRRSRMWGLFALVFFVLALGPHAHFLGRQIPIPMPYLWLDRYIPIVSFTGIPARFSLPGQICVAIMSGYALAHVFGRDGHHTARNLALTAMAVSVIAVENLGIPCQMRELDIQSFYHRMAEDNDDYAVIDVPSTSITLYRATVHGKPIVGGYVSRASRSNVRFLRSTPVLATLFAGRPPPVDPDLPSTARSLFAELNVRYVISHGNYQSQFLEEALRLPIIEQAGNMKVYDCRSGVGDSQ